MAVFQIFFRWFIVVSMETFLIVIVKIYLTIYVIVIARDRVQYEIYFPSSDIFVSLFSEPLGEENNNKNIRTKYIVRVTCDNYFIISTKNI